MGDVDAVIEYHERTKHRFDRYARSAGCLDWDNQPNPFRTFAGAPCILLPLAEDVGGPAYSDIFEPGRVAAEPVQRSTIARLLECSLGISAWKEYRDNRWALRCNPSSGNLHPTEGYVIAPAIEGLHGSPAVYHYAPESHALERRTAFTEEPWRELARDVGGDLPQNLAGGLSSGSPDGGFFLGLSSIHWREAWKYGERAYRYCQHDTGHALAAVAIAAASLGWMATRCESIADDDLARLLGIDREGDFDGAEREHPALLIAIAPAQRGEADPQPAGSAGDTARRRDVADVRSLTVAAPTESRTPPQSFGAPTFSAPTISEAAVAQVAAGQWFGTANRLSSEHVDWPAIDMVARACRKPATSPPAWPARSAKRRELDGVKSDRPAREVIRARRSALTMDEDTTISRDTFLRMLARTMPVSGRVPWDALGPPACVDLVLFVHRVEGVEPGIYCLVRRPDHEAALRGALESGFRWRRPAGCPDDLPLYLLAGTDCRRAAGVICCGQSIAADGVFSLAMLAEFERPLREVGPWMYQRLFWETGAIGQVLYLEAEAAGVRATGIGCFFDDPAHEVIGLGDRSFQSLYHFTVGGPIEDTRLTTLPAYDRRLRSD